MQNKRNIYLFYSYFIFFLFSTSLIRNILTTYKQIFSLETQLVFFPLCLLLISPVLIIIAKNSLYNNKIVAWLAFIMLAISFWDLSNYLPLIGFGLASYIHHAYGITLPLDTAPIVFRYTIMLGAFLLGKKYILLFFSALLANKKCFMNKVNFKSNDGNEIYFSPEKSIFLFNEKTGILSISYKKRDFLFSTKHFLKQDNKTFFTPLEGNKNPPLSSLKIKDGILFLKEKDKNIVFLMSKFNQSFQKIISELLSDNKNEDVIIIGESKTNIEQNNSDKALEIHPINPNAEQTVFNNDDETIVVTKK